MTGEEKVHGSFSQGSQPLTSSFQRLRVQVCKILRSTTDSGETWFTLSQTWVWRDGLTQRKWCTLSKFKTIPSLLVHNIYLSCTPLPFVSIFNMKMNSCLNVFCSNHVLRRACIIAVVYSHSDSFRVTCMEPLTACLYSVCSMYNTRHASCSV